MREGAESSGRACRLTLPAAQMLARLLNSKDFLKWDAGDKCAVAAFFSRCGMHSLENAQRVCLCLAECNGYTAPGEIALFFLTTVFACVCPLAVRRAGYTTPRPHRGRRCRRPARPFPCQRRVLGRRGAERARARGAQTSRSVLEWKRGAAPVSTSRHTPPKGKQASRLGRRVISPQNTASPAALLRLCRLRRRAVGDDTQDW